MRIDAGTAVVVCAGPSLDRLSADAWREIGNAGAIAGINGASASLACRTHGVRFTYVAAMDLAMGLAERVPDLATVWRNTPAWRVASADATSIDAESYIVEVDEEQGIAGWSDDDAQGYKGGSTGMVVGNWLGNDWPGDRAALETISEQTGKSVPRRGFRRIAYIGLDMQPGNGVHARGAGNHISGFANSQQRFDNVSRGWGRLCAEARRRGIEVVNLTPETGLEAMPRAEVPQTWIKP